MAVEMPGAHKPSRFNMKGNAWKGLQEFVDKTVPGGTFALLERLPLETRSFFQQIFIPGVWYDVVPVEEIARTAATAIGQPHDAFCREFGEFTYTRDMTGIYRALLRFASPELMVKALPLATKRYFDFVVLDTKHIGPKAYDVHLSGIPQKVIATYAVVTSVFIQRSIEASGGKNVSAQLSTPKPGQTIDGTPTSTIVRCLRWE